MKKTKKNRSGVRIRRLGRPKAGDYVIVGICALLVIIFLLPILNILARSLSSSTALIKGKVWLWPVELNLTAYKSVLGDSRYTTSLAWTAFLTVVSTVWCLIMTIMCAFPFVYPKLRGRKFFNTIIIITMFFNAGTIPNYLLMKSLGLLDNWLVLVLPGSISVFNMIVLRSFFYGIPDSLREAAEIDGAGPIRILLKIYLPLSLPVLATLALFFAVGRWNAFSDALMYISPTHREMYPIQLLLYQMLNTAQSVEPGELKGPGAAETIKAATVMFSTVPILLIYPWLQRFFIKGATLGAEKE